MTIIYKSVKQNVIGQRNKTVFLHLKLTVVMSHDKLRIS